MWAVHIVLVFYALFSDINKALDVGGLETDIRLVPIDMVPFPAIIVDLCGEVDPVGYIAASKDISHDDGFPKDGRWATKKKTSPMKWQTSKGPGKVFT